jgi:hypothetical protein
MLPPIDVKANKLLYYRIFCKKCFDIVLSLLLINIERNGGGSLYGGILICPYLQHFEYNISLFFLESSLFLSLNQNMALQYLHIYSDGNIY